MGMKSEQPERDSAPQVAPQMVHIDFQPRKKHQVEQAYLPEDIERAVAVEHVESVGPDHHTGHNHAYYVRNLQLRENHRCQQYYCQHYQEDGDGVGD